MGSLYDDLLRTAAAINAREQVASDAVIAGLLSLEDSPPPSRDSVSDDEAIALALATTMAEELPASSRGRSRGRSRSRSQRGRSRSRSRERTPQDSGVGKECPVCQENMQLSTKRCLLGCGHVFHHKCITPWLRGHNTCPTCREVVTNKTTVKAS